jgi:hypothetical protein
MVHVSHVQTTTIVWIVPPQQPAPYANPPTIFLTSPVVHVYRTVNNVPTQHLALVASTHLIYLTALLVQSVQV